MLEAKSVEEYVSNPINSLNMIKRTSSEIDKYNLTEIWRNNGTKNSLEKLNNLTQTFPRLFRKFLLIINFLDE